MTTPLLVGVGIAVAATGARVVMRAIRNYRARPASSILRPMGKQFIEGGFEPTMSEKEARQILGVLDKAAKDDIRNAHRQLMRLNHPDAGGSAYLSTKINEAKDLLVKGKRSQ